MVFRLIVSALCLCSLPAFAGVYRFNVNSYEYMLIPREEGRLLPITTGHDVYYPSRDHFAQLIIFLDSSENTSKLIRTTDTDPQYAMRWRVYSNSSTAPCVNGEWCLEITYNSPTAPGYTETDYTGTNWRTAANEYKAWLIQQTWWRGHGKVSRLSHVMNCATTHYTTYDADLDTVAAQFNHAVGCFMTQYRTNLFDQMYPNYTCSVNANCQAWLQNMKDAGVIGLPYINGELWDADEPSYSASEMCLDSGGTPLDYGLNNLKYKYLDQAWADLLRSKFDAIRATDGSRSDGVYIDVIGAGQPQLCYVNGVQQFDDSIAGIKLVFEAFADKVIMAEWPAEIYLPYVDIGYNFAGSANANWVNLYGYLYSDAPGFHVVGYPSGTNTSQASILDAHIKNLKLCHDAMLLSDIAQEQALSNYTTLISELDTKRIAPCGYALRPNKRR